MNHNIFNSSNELLEIQQFTYYNRDEQKLRFFLKMSNYDNIMINNIIDKIRKSEYYNLCNNLFECYKVLHIQEYEINLINLNYYKKIVFVRLIKLI